MSGASRERALSLLAAARGHGDPAVRISSLQQAGEILLSVDPSSASELFPYLADLHSSPDVIVRRYLAELLGELGPRAIEHSLVLMPALFSLLKDGAPVVIKQSIISGKKFFCTVLEEMIRQYYQSINAGRWLEEMRYWMVRFKDEVSSITLEPGSLGTKLLGVKFLETFVLLFTPEALDHEASISEGKRRNFDVSQLGDSSLILEANKTLGLLVELSHSDKVCGSLTIVIINSLAGIARKRPIHYNLILSTLFNVDSKIVLKKGHAASIHYSLRTAFLGFLRCTHPFMMESREMLLKSLRSMNAGEAADQVLRQVDKMLKGTDRITRDARISRDDVSSIEGPVSGDPSGKKYIVQGSDGPTSMDESPPKRTRYNSDISLAQSTPLAIEDQDDATLNGFSSNVSLTDRDPTPAEQMIGMIGALLAEGERGAESLEILISKIQPDLMADIVIANMKHLPSTSLPLFSRLDNLPATSQASSYALPQFMPPVSAPIPPPPLGSTHQVTSSVASGTGFGISTSDISPASNLLPDSKRDPRRDPRRLDPRRIAVPAEAQSAQITDDQSGLDGSLSGEVSLMAKSEGTILPMPSKNNMEIPDNAAVPSPDSSLKKNGVLDEFKKNVPSAEVHAPSDLMLSPVHVAVQEQDASSSSDVTENEGADISMPESDQSSSAVPSTSTSEVVSHELPLLPPYVELMDEQKKLLGKLTVVRIIEAYEQIQAIGGSQLRLSLLSRLVAQTNNDDEIVVLLQKHIIPDYQHHKGHELAMEVLYHLHSVMVSKPDELSSSCAAKLYEKFLVEVAKSLCDSFPASDKSFSKLLSEVPLLPASALKLLEDLCRSHGYGQHDKVTFDGDRVTQGLGTVWSLILGRPLDRRACLDIALKCTIDTQDEVRARAIRLVANKLYQVDYVSQMIEQFATDMLLSVVDQQTPDVELATGSSEQSTEVGSQEIPIVGSQSSELGASESDPIKSAQPPPQNAATISLSQAHRHMSLYFALCAKKPDLLQLVFDIYGRAPKPVKQAVNRHIPILLRTLGSSYSELLRIISDPPPGSESLLMLVLQILTEMVPPADLVATVKHLYETKIKDAAILIPMLSLLSKDEVLPIFPQLVGLPLDKFQTALARILQGSAHTGPALTPAEVLVAIHEIHPEKDGVALKKVMDACTACFEQRTVFTQHVLEKSLNVLVEKMPLPLLLMRTVIQAIDAFPTLVDFVMGILSRLVSKQIWKMPKLWVGFLKCAYQTQPHSFPVLLQLPPPLLESALNKHPSLRGPLAAHANQPTVRTSLPRATLEVLGLGDESQQSSRSYIPSTSSSIHGTVLPL